MDGDRLREDLARRLVPVVEHPDAQRLGEAEGQARPGGVVAQQAVRVGHAGDGHAVLRLGVVDAVAAGDGAAGQARDVEAAAQDLGGQLGGKDVARPAERG